jgi:hypothetical protein
MAGWRRNRALSATVAACCALLVLAGPAAANDSRHGDDDPAGTIASYDDETNLLVIALADGGSVSGIVTGRTWIDDGERRCGERHRAAARRHGDWCGKRRTGDHGWHHNRGEESDLVAGAVVEDAILVLKDGKAWFAKIELD